MVQIHGNSRENVPPVSLKPNKGEWSYSSPTNLTISGIYIKNELETVKNRIVFTIEQTSVIETLAQQFTNESKTYPSILNILNEDVLDHLAESAWDETWGKFIIFSIFSAGIIGILMCFRLIKSVADIVINGYALHSAYS